MLDGGFIQRPVQPTQQPIQPARVTRPTGVPVVELRQISQSFIVGEETIPVLREVDFSITENTFNIIYGPSGSGKSTLLNILTGLQRPSTGIVKFRGQEVYKFSSDRLAHFRANEIGIMYQQNYWVKSLNVVENVAIPLFFLGHGRHEATKIALDTLKKFNMDSYAKKVPFLLSGGEQQRIGLARAVVTNPMVIVADEPTGNLDSKTGDMIMGLMKSYQNELKRTIILVTHNLEYLPLADQLIHISDGRVEHIDEGDIQSTTHALIKDMTDRIDRIQNERNSTSAPVVQ